MSLITSGFGNYLKSAVLPVTAGPFTVGIWFQVNGGGSGTLWGMGASGVNTDYFDLLAAAGGSISFAGNDSVAGSTAAVPGITVASNNWYFAIAREVGSANHWVHALDGKSGATGSGQSTTSVTPAGVDAMTLTTLLINAGATFTMAAGGFIAEYWLCNKDIVPDGGAMSDALLRQLAYGGPFSVPHVAANLVEYRDFRTGPDGASYVGQTGKIRRSGDWLTVGTRMLAGPHPPLPYWYKRPTEDIAQIAMM